VVSEEPALSDAEAAKVTARLERMRALDCQRNETGFAVTLQVPTFETIHHLAEPTAAERLAYRRGQKPPVELGCGRTLLPFNLEPAWVRYDCLFQRAEGYAGEGPGAVPVIHKLAAVRVLLEVIDSAERAGF